MPQNFSKKKEAVFWGNKTLNQRFGANFKIPVFWRILLQISYLFCFLPLKTLKMTILTSVWHAQHPNTGWNIQQLCVFLKKNHYNRACQNIGPTWTFLKLECKPLGQSYNTFYTWGQWKIKCLNCQFNDKEKCNPTNMSGCSVLTLIMNKSLC